MTARTGVQARHGANDLLRAARLALPSPSGSGKPLSRQELAEAVNATVYAASGEILSLDSVSIVRLESGKNRWPNEQVRMGFRAVLGKENDADLGFFDPRVSASRGRQGCGS